MTSRIMTPEIRKKLSGLLPFAPGASLPFTPEAFQSVEEAFRPVFHMRGFSLKTLSWMAGKAASGTITGDVMADALKDGAIGGWENLPDMASGEDIPFSLEAIGTFPLHLVSALYTQAAQLSGLTEEEKEGLT